MAVVADDITKPLGRNDLVNSTPFCVSVHILKACGSALSECLGGARLEIKTREAERVLTSYQDLLCFRRETYSIL